MDKCGYDFVIMVKGMKDFVSEIVLETQGTFEQNRACSIRDYRVSGTTVRKQLFASDEQERYFHVYYSGTKCAAEREALETKIDKLSSYLQAQQGTQVELGTVYDKYFDLIYYHKGKEDERFEFARERTDVINREIKLCGYFVIITSEKMTAQEAIDLYKSRDGSEKLFRGDKSYLGNRSARVYTDERIDTKIFIEFVALIIRSRIYVLLKEEMRRAKNKQNYMTVPAAFKELEKIEMIRQMDKEYRLDHAVTATQKAILKAFGLTEVNVREQARAINDDLLRIAEKNARKSAQVS